MESSQSKVQAAEELSRTLERQLAIMQGSLEAAEAARQDLSLRFSPLQVALEEVKLNGRCCVPFQQARAQITKLTEVNKQLEHAIVKIVQVQSMKSSHVHLAGQAAHLEPGGRVLRSLVS